MKLYGGIDLHSNNSVIALLDETDNVVYQRCLPNDLTLMLAELAPFTPAIAGLVVESTHNWYWLVDGLMAAGYRMHLANTAAIVQGRIPNFPCHVEAGMKDGFAMVFSKFQRPALK
jgi:transposase